MGAKRKRRANTVLAGVSCVLLLCWSAACSDDGRDLIDSVPDAGAGAASGSGGSSGWGGGSGGSGITCSRLAADSGWSRFFCEVGGNYACAGVGTPTDDCEFCCETPSIGAGGAGGGGSGGTSASGGSGATGGTGGSTGGAGGSGGSTGGTGATGSLAGFGYPVGDKSSSPAGGWVVWQIMSHYSSSYGGRHLAQDISSPAGGVNAIDAPVYSIADGVVLYAKPNSSTYRNVILIEHDVGDGGKVCSFYGHVNPPLVSAGQRLTRGQKIATVMDWAQAAAGGASSNTHLHYVLVDQALCAAAKNWSSICGYDNGGDNGLSASNLSQEPYYYTAVNEYACGTSNYPKGFISPTKFIDDHHF